MIVKEEHLEIRDELDKLTERIQKQEQLFDLIEDEDLIEAIIYEHKALQARYAYLIKKAREA
ncbi:MAG: YaaL family protein [Oscillospiraceae bacterium]|nr:YaaL family protein [Oscillospiraceae bacterium]